MLSIPDMALLGAAALLLFGPEQLPRVLRKVGQVTRDVQNTSQSFIREMERAADTYDVPDAPPRHQPEDLHPYVPYEDPELAAAAAAPEQPVGEKLAEPRPAALREPEPPEPEPQSWDYPTQPMPQVTRSRPTEPPPESDHPAHV